MRKRLDANNKRPGKANGPKVAISHNPYNIKTEILIDGKQTENTNLLELVKKGRLQMWVDELIPKLMESLDCHVAEMMFTGTTADGEDVRDAVSKHSSEYSITLTLKDGGHPDAKLTALKSLFLEAKTGPIHELKAPAFLDEFKRAINPDFEVSVQAPMKAGKSTFINAMIGHALLPENIEACTATITYIADDDRRNDFTGCAYDFEDKPLGNAKRYKPVNAELLHKWNRDDVKEIRISGNIRSIESKNIRLVVVDTPGPNNSENKKHGLAVERFIKDSANTMVLYLLNITQYQSDDNLRCLKRIANEMSKDGRQSSDRFLFVLTRTDEYDPEKDNISQKVDGIRDFLAAQGIAAARIVPVTAKFAKLARMKRVGKHLTEDEDDELNTKMKRFLKNPKLDYLQYANVTADVHMRVSMQRDAAKKKNDNYCLMECYTGLVVVEATIQEFIEKYAVPMKIYDAYIALKGEMARFNLIAQIAKSSAENEEKRKALHEQMEKAKKRQEDGKEALNFRERANQIKWNDTGEHKKTAVKYNAKVEALYGSFSEILRNKGDWLPPEFVKEKTAEFEEAVDETFNECAVSFENAANAAVMSQYKELISDYVQYVKDLLGSGEVNAPEFTIIFPTMPRLDDLRQAATSSVVVRTEERLKDNIIADLCTLWLRRIFESQYETIEHKGNRVDVGAYLRDIRSCITESFAAAEVKASAATNNEVRSVVQGFLKEMDRLDNAISNTIKDIKNITQSQQVANQVNKKLDEKRQWLVNFEAKLNDLIQI